MANILSHYTSFDAALLILLGGKVKLGNILNSNDQEEIESIKELKENYLIFCGCMKPITSLMWFAYAKNKYGACISFNLKKGEKKRGLLATSKETPIVSKKVDYRIEAKDNNKVGFIKDAVFKDEVEYRYLYKGNRESVLVDINWNIIESITLTVSSFFTEEIVRSIVEKRIPVKLNVVIERRFNC